MGFRWLFGSKSGDAAAAAATADQQQEQHAHVDQADGDEYTPNSISTSNNNSTGNNLAPSPGGNLSTGATGNSVDDEILGPADSTPSALDDLSRPLKVPLNAIPSFMVDDRPELKLSEYDMSRGQFARNVLALTHNAVRLEMADMWGDILPSLQSRCDVIDLNDDHKQKAKDKAADGSNNPENSDKSSSDADKAKDKDASATAATDTNNNGNANASAVAKTPKQLLTQADADDIRSWWSGFARFALTASLVDDFVCKKAFDELYVGFDKELKQVEKQYRKVLEKNNVYLEMAVRKMAKSVDDFENDFSGKGFTALVKAWQSLASMLADIYTESESLVESIDRWVRDPFQYKDLEKQAAKIFTNKKRWGEDDSKRGEMIVILCRWVGTEDLMREWMYRNLTKKELRSIDKWMDDYRDKRLAIIDRFHQKKAN